MCAIYADSAEKFARNKSKIQATRNKNVIFHAPYFDLEEKESGPLMKTIEIIVTKKSMGQFGFIPSVVAEAVYEKFCYWNTVIKRERVVKEIFK